MKFLKNCLRFFNLVKSANLKDQSATELTTIDIDAPANGITIESVAVEESVVSQDVVLEEEPNQSSNDDPEEYMNDVQEKDPLATDSD